MIFGYPSLISHLWHPKIWILLWLQAYNEIPGTIGTVAVLTPISRKIGWIFPDWSELYWAMESYGPLHRIRPRHVAPSFDGCDSCATKTSSTGYARNLTLRFHWNDSKHQFHQLSCCLLAVWTSTIFGVTFTNHLRLKLLQVPSRRGCAPVQPRSYVIVGVEGALNDK